MEQTFMTIHNLSPDATILFASHSIADILGYQPAEVQGKSCFDYFHPTEVPFARSVHSRGVLLDKAAVLHYCRILSRDGRWVGCECCFTIVHDVLVACTSIYCHGAKSRRRAIEAPQIRRIFACSSRDPRYHMLEHLSPKFKMSPMEREPRAALILNRFTRNLTVMFATNAISAIIGLRPDQIKNKSFYRCIQESYLSEATQCLESAKANDSIAYLRFYFQDPREDDELDDNTDIEIATDDARINQDGYDGINIDLAQLRRHERRDRQDDTMGVAMDVDTNPASGSSALHNGMAPIKTEEDDEMYGLKDVPAHLGASRSSRLPSIELEAVVSCTSDGLVVVLRKARPRIPPAHPPLVPVDYGDGLFAAPWGQQPTRTLHPPDSLHTFRPPLLPKYMPLRENGNNSSGRNHAELMGSIRDVAVFAWGVIGINPDMAAYGRGLPSGEAHPSQTRLTTQKDTEDHTQWTTDDTRASLSQWPPTQDAKGNDGLAYASLPHSGSGPGALDLQPAWNIAGMQPPRSTTMTGHYGDMQNAPWQHQQIQQREHPAATDYSMSASRSFMRDTRWPGNSACQPHGCRAPTGQSSHPNPEGSGPYRLFSWQ